jgi:hypothetical protein
MIPRFIDSDTQNSRHANAQPPHKQTKKKQKINHFYNNLNKQRPNISLPKRSIAAVERAAMNAKTTQNAK